MTLKKASLSATSVLALATGAAKRKRGATSNARAGASFQDLIRAATDTPDYCWMIGQPVAKVVGSGQKRIVVYTAKNGVDFVGVAHGKPVAIEAKRLPGAASLSGAKNESTRAEARFLSAFCRARGFAGYLVYDPDVSGPDLVAHIYVVCRRDDFDRIEAGAPVALRDRAGVPRVERFAVPVGGEISAIRRAIAWTVQP